MIREFWIENYLSIRDRQTFNFEADRSDDNWMNVEVSKDVHIGRVGMIFGANFYPVGRNNKISDGPQLSV